MRVSVAVPVAVLLAARCAGQGNLIANGNFESGNSGFASDYSYSAGGNCCEGQYTVRNNGSSFNGFFVNPQPSISGSELMMVVNGSTVPNQRIWYQTVGVTPGRAYRLSIDGCTAVAGGPAILQWQIDGALIGSSLTLPSVTQQWSRLSTDWTAPAGVSSIQLAVRNLNTSSFPNDFYIDNLTMDESVVQCGPADVGSQGGQPGADGQLNNNDFIVFIDRFFAQSPLADIGTTGGASGSDGLFDNNDFIVFIDRFFTGC